MSNWRYIEFYLLFTRNCVKPRFFCNSAWRKNSSDAFHWPHYLLAVVAVSVTALLFSGLSITIWGDWVSGIEDKCQYIKVIFIFPYNQSFTPFYSIASNTWWRLEATHPLPNLLRYDIKLFNGTNAHWEDSLQSVSPIYHHYSTVFPYRTTTPREFPWQIQSWVLRQ